MSDSSVNSGGIGVVGLLGCLFVFLKLTGYIDWSWWCVTLPFWGGLAVIVVIGVIALFIWLVSYLLSWAIKSTSSKG